MDVDVIRQPCVFIALINVLAQRTEVIDARDALDTGLLVEQLIDVVDAHARLAHQVEDDAWVDITGTRTHGETSQRGKAHRGIDGTAIADGRRRGAIAQVQRDLVRVLRIAVQDLRHLLGDELV